MLALILLLAFPGSGTVSVNKEACSTGWFDANKEYGPGMPKSALAPVDPKRLDLGGRLATSRPRTSLDRPRRPWTSTAGTIGVMLEGSRTAIHGSRYFSGDKNGCDFLRCPARVFRARPTPDPASSGGSSYRTASAAALQAVWRDVFESGKQDAQAYKALGKSWKSKRSSELLRWYASGSGVKR
jgi:hypothetical protein